MDVNTPLLDTYENIPATGYVGNYVGGTIDRNQLIVAGRQMARYYARIVRGLYGITGNFTPAFASANALTPGVDGAPSVYAYDAQEIFFVKSEYHQAHHDTVVAEINNDPGNEISGDVQLDDVNNFLNRLLSIAVNHKNDTMVDLRVCHSSCHTSCHSARGRR